ncbi:DMT family transporter [Austwickia chelonae]|uniref:DMT family transporter n=1 Tax=Austwickia chelonae TaxID=100225 RepID=UPI000E23AD49|nr:DMT family transporter [Austwickia chelonae]
MNALLGPLVALAAALAYGGSDFLGGMLSRRRPAAAVVGVSQACSLVFLVLVVAVVGIPDDWSWLPWAVGAGAAGAMGLIFFYTALASGTVSVVSPISATGAILPVAIAFLGGERPGAVKVTGIVLALFGAVLASGPELRGEPHVKARAVWLAVLAAICFGVTVYAIARGSQVSALATMLGMRATSVTGFVMAAVITRSVGGVKPGELPVLAAVGITDVGANLLLGISTTLGMVSVTTVLASLYPVVTVAMAAIFLHERMRPIQMVGVIAALAGVVLIAGV